jgi:toxin-antitoxin system PIN domain toxin
MTPDVNVLIAASRSDHPLHRVAYKWMSEAVASCAQGASLKLMPIVAASFLRLVTNAKIFVQPTPIGDAMLFLDALLETPGVEMPAQGEEWPLLRQLCVTKRLSANDIPDAWLASAVIRHGDHLVTFDTDFRKLLPSGQLTILAET